MDTAENIAAVPDLSLDQGDVVFAIQAVDKSVSPEIPVFGRKMDLCHPVDQLIVAFPVVLQILDGDKSDAPLVSELFELGGAHHRAVLPHDLTAEAALLQTCQPAQVHSGFCMAVPLQNTVLFGEQGEHMPGPAEVLGLCVILDTGQRGHGPLLGGDPCRRGHMVDGDRKGRLMVVRVGPDHLRDLQAAHKCFRHGHTDQPLAMSRHKVNVFCSGKFRGADKIPFVLTVRIICDKYDLSIAQILQRFLYCIELTHSLYTSMSKYFSVSFRSRASSETLL